MDDYKYRFKMIYDNLTPEEINLIEELKSSASDLYSKIDDIPVSGEVNLALTNLEQAMMWAIKAMCLASERKKGCF